MLLHVGGPADLDDVERFHLDLWSDPAVAPLSLASIWTKRAAAKAWAAEKAVRERGYNLIGGRSPVSDLLQSQALALENRLAGRLPMAAPAPGPARVAAATRFGRPTIEDALAELARARVRRVVAIPLYPHDDPSTNGLCREHLRSVAREKGFTTPLGVVPPFFDRLRFQRLLIERTRRSFDLIPPDLRGEAFLLFAMHSPPEARLKKTHLLAQAEATSQAVMAAVGYGEERSAVAFQSFGGPAKTLAPAIGAFAVERAQEGVKALVVVPLSHVTDSFETLHDLDIQLYQAAVEAGVKQFRRVPTPNADPEFIGLLADLVVAHVPEEQARRLRGATDENAAS